MLYRIRILLILFSALLSYNCGAANPNLIYIRANQVGFLQNDIKTAVVFSEYPLKSPNFNIVNSFNSKVIYQGKIKGSLHGYDKFKYSYTLDFSNIKKPGKYIIEINGTASYPFRIGEKIYNNVVDSLMLFFKVQRCGPTKPYLHGVCHLSDVARVEGYNKGMVDVTGGWHDAGDYIKFLSTAAYTTYMMIFSYEFDRSKFDFDNNNNGVPDILEEAKIGLDWLLRCNFTKYQLITQVQDLRDHNVGWRLPENDTLRYDRVGYMGMGKNQIGLFSAVLAMASRVWKDKFHDEQFSRKCLQAAENIYSLKNTAPDIDSSQSGFYQDNGYWGKLALGAIELYKTLGEKSFLEEAKTFADSAGSDYWWSWGNINALADYNIARFEPRFQKYLRNNIVAFNNTKNKSVFNEPMPYSWGTTNSFLGAALQAILYKTLTNSREFDSLAVFQRDYVMGRNPWGISFIYNIGSNYPRNLHSQVAYFKGGYLPGALSAGPAPENILKNYDIKRTNFKYNFFNTYSVKYYDDRMDYITNEPTITGNATAVFVYGYYSNR